MLQEAQSLWQCQHLVIVVQCLSGTRALSVQVGNEKAKTVEEKEANLGLRGVRLKGALQQNFFISAWMIFLLKLLLKSASKSSFFRFGVEIHPVLELQIAAICGAVVRNSIAFGNSVSADRSGMVASTFLAAAAASVILLCFASESRASHCIMVRESCERCFGSRFF